MNKSEQAKERVIEGEGEEKRKEKENIIIQKSSELEQGVGRTTKNRFS